MAKRREASTGTVILVSLLFLLAFALAYVAPFVIIGMWAWYEYQARKDVDRNVQAGSERSEERRLLREGIDASAARADQLYQEGLDRGLDRRHDRMFDARYADARELNGLISAERDAQITAQQQLAAIVAPLARRDALRFALIGYFGMLLWLWSSSSDLTGFARSAWASVVALVVGLITYAVRKSHYAEN